MHGEGRHLEQNTAEDFGAGILHQHRQADLFLFLSQEEAWKLFPGSSVQFFLLPEI